MAEEPESMIVPTLLEMRDDIEIRHGPFEALPVEPERRVERPAKGQ